MQTIREQKLSNGLLETIQRTTVGYESPDLKKRFDELRYGVEQRLESGETESATIAEHRRIGRNDPCPCGSKEKFKRCCGSRLAEDDERIVDGERT